MRPSGMTILPTDRYGLIRRTATLRLGISDDAVTAAVRRGELVRLAPGVCAYSVDESAAEDPLDRLYRLKSVAVATSARDRNASVLSHDSAAAVHKLPLLHPAREVVHLTKTDKVCGFGHGLRIVHAGPVASGDVVDVDGVRLTSLERTAVDVAMAGDFARALVVFDRALAADADVSTMATSSSRAGDGAVRGLPVARCRTRTVHRRVSGSRGAGHR